MASTIINTNFGVPMVTRGKPSNLGTINATGQVVTFTVSARNEAPNGFDAVVITTTGNLVAATPILECSIDGGVTWFSVGLPSSSSSVPTLGTTVLNSDTATTSANAYTIAGLQGLGLFRFGFTTFTSGSGACWVAISG
jgi:hypothetical protein